MRVCQFDSHKNWLFFKLEVEPPAEIWKLDFTCYPSTSHWAHDVPERERIAESKESVYNVSKGKFEFTPQSPGLIFYNKYVYGDDGCMALVDNQAVQKIVLPKTTNGISPDVFLKPGRSSFVFALGGFRDTPAEKEATMFLGESQDGVFTFLKGIDWNPKIDGGKVEKLARDLQNIFKLAEGMNLPVEPAARAEAEKLRAQGQETIKNDDLAAFEEVAQKLGRLKDKVLAGLLDNYNAQPSHKDAKPSH